MKNKSVIRNYHLTDAVLIVEVNEKIAFIQRDAAVFETFGITTTNIADLQNEANAFSAFQTDAEIKGSQAAVTMEKKAKASELIEAINTVMTMVSLRFKKNSLIYYHFGTSDITHKKGSNLTITARLVAAMASKYFQELAPYGLTTAHLDNIMLLNEEFSELLIDQQIAINERVVYRESRIAKGNAIYKTLQQYLGAGLAYWESRSAARHNDYLLYAAIR